MTAIRVTLLVLVAHVAIGQPAKVDGTVPRDGFDLHYTLIGNGKPMLVLSGGPGFDIGYMEPVARELAAARQCILVEQRGTGRSKPPKLTRDNMTLSLMVEDLDAVRKKRGGEKIDVLGHSWGGMLAMAYAAAHPGNINSLVLVGSGGMNMSFAEAFNSNIEARLWPADREAFARAVELRKADVLKGSEASVLAKTPAYFYDREAARKFVAAFPEGSYHADVAANIMPDLMKSYDVRAALRGFEGPALIVNGHQDPIPEGIAYEIHAALKNSQLVFLNKCGHFPWLEQPAEFLKTVREFLAQHR
jgi:proline iminopeptidase